MLNKNNIYLVVWMVFIMLLMGIPGNYFPHTPSLLELFSPDKIIHLFLFGILSPLVFKVLQNKYAKYNQRNLVVLSILFGTIYGALTEILQKFVFIGREGSIFDLIFDLVGLCLGLWIFLRLSLNSKKIK